MVNRQDGSGQLWSPKKDSRVCSLHFVDGRPTPENPYPSLNLGYADTERKVKRLLFSDQVNLPPAKKKRCLIMPSIEVPLSKPDLDPLGGDPSAEQSRDATRDLPPCLLTVVSVHWTWFTAFLLLIQCLWRLACRYHDQARALHKQVQGLTLLLAEEKRKVVRLVAQVEKMKADSKDTSFASQFLKTDDDVKFYTGIEKLFNELLEFVAPYIQRRWHGTISLLKSVRHFAGRRGPKPRLRTCDEFLMTLMRLRLGLLTKDLAARFRVSAPLCSRIFFSWIRGMSTVLGT
ncbi:uncharacterized protein LOC124118438 [Haliotis rufescens]|uniref:uncharacterized protein LOC124118438 n=1 Tax=Haliotis rufescens TaxID=6454 RepID=UPI00201F738D|nr:uncharacterized protein LOC124118438 [Haliotis rufescens]